MQELSKAIENEQAEKLSLPTGQFATPLLSTPLIYSLQIYDGF
jgi:hypothetical protein